MCGFQAHTLHKMDGSHHDQTGPSMDFGRHEICGACISRGFLVERRQNIASLRLLRLHFYDIRRATMYVTLLQAARTSPIKNAMRKNILIFGKTLPPMSAAVHLMFDIHWITWWKCYLPIWKFIQIALGYQCFFVTLAIFFCFKSAAMRGVRVSEFPLQVHALLIAFEINSLRHQQPALEMLQRTRTAILVRSNAFASDFIHRQCR